MVKRNERKQKERVVRDKFQRQLPEIYPQTPNQQKFYDELCNKTIVVGDGCAGTGKTLMSCHWAAKQLHEGHVKKIILLRAYQPLANRSIGLLPGTEEEKLMSTYIQMLQYLEEILGKATVEIHLKNRTIDMCSLETIRGRNFEDAVVIVDESQNLFPAEIKALVTRLGDNCQMVLVGDGTGFQTDVRKGKDGLTYLIEIADEYNIQGVGIVTFTVNDILRSGIVREFVIAFDREMNMGNPIEEGKR